MKAPWYRANASTFPCRGLEDLLEAAQQGSEGHRISSHPTGSPEHVAVPPLAMGSQILAHIPICETPPVARWNEDGYESAIPWVCEVQDALLHSSAGIVGVGGCIIADTLIHTTGRECRYERTGDLVHLLLPGTVERLSGAWLALPTGNHRNYFHWTLDALGRLASVSDELLANCRNVLVPPLDAEFHRSGLLLTGLPRTHVVQEMPVAATFEVERLFVPCSLMADLRPHRCLGRYFRSLAKLAGTPTDALPRRCYVARRSSRNRRLMNEEELILALAPLGVAAIELERLPLAEQIALFSQAELIVAPHGAGLANLVYASPGSRLIELHMDSYVNWCFRRLAAACDVGYDCVVGRHAPGSDPASVHAQEWSVSITHVLGAVEQMLGR
jgi:capsular polysaccharide biosynthesis protein